MRTRGRDGRYQISLLCRAERGLCPTYCLFCCPQPPPYTRCWGGRRTLPFTPAYHHQQICLFSSLKKQTHTNTSMETLRGSHGERPGPRTGGSGLSHPASSPCPRTHGIGFLEREKGEGQGHRGSDGGTMGHEEEAWVPPLGGL